MPRQNPAPSKPHRADAPTAAELAQVQIPAKKPPEAAKKKPKYDHPRDVLKSYLNPTQKRVGVIGTGTGEKPSGKSMRILPTMLQEDATDISGLYSIEWELATSDLASFVQQAWHLVEPAVPFAPGWHIESICQHLQAVTEGRIRKLLIAIPPRHCKSTLVSVMWPAWTWARFPQRKFLCASYASGLALRDAVKCRRILQSAWYQQRWGQMFKLTGDQNAKERYENSASGYRLATSVGGSATGEGGDVIITDDPHNLEEAESDLSRQSVIDWWDQVMATRENDPKRSSRVIIMQRCHEGDLAGHVLQKELGWVYLCLPAEFDPARCCETLLPFRDPRQEEGELLWPQRFDRATLEALKRTLGTYGASAQLQQLPAPKAGGLVKREWWRFWDTLPVQFDEMIQSWDMAFKDLASSDYVVGQVWGRIGANKYLVDQIRKRLSFTATLEAVKELSYRYPKAHSKLVEDRANGAAVIDTLKRQVSGLIAVNPEGGKIARAAAVSPQVESGCVYLPSIQLHPWAEEFIYEWLWFPKGSHDDQVDACTQALLRLEKHERTYASAPVVSYTQTSFWRHHTGQEYA